MIVGELGVFKLSADLSNVLIGGPQKENGLKVRELLRLDLVDGLDVEDLLLKNLGLRVGDAHILCVL